MKFSSPSRRAGFLRRIVGGFISVFVAWLFLQLVMLIIFTFQARPFPLWVDAMYFAIGSFPFVFVPELVFFLPLYVFVPPHSILWRWSISTACGAAFGGALMFVLGYPNPLSSQSVFDTVLAALSGGITCLFASLTMPKFHYSKRADEAVQQS